MTGKIDLFRLCVLLVGCCWLGPQARSHAEACPIIYLQPLGDALPELDLQAVQQALRSFYGLETRLLPRAAMPREAYYSRRRRYRAEKLLSFLERRLPEDGFRVMGLTTADISTTKGKHADWGILGLASINGRVCVISSFRCRKGARGAGHVRERLGKVAVHEVGHTLGLEHCPVKGCLMQDARGKVRTSDEEYDLCPRCRKKLSVWDRPVTTHPNIPWLKPGVLNRRSDGEKQR